MFTHVWEKDAGAMECKTFFGRQAPVYNSGKFSKSGQEYFFVFPILHKGQKPLPLEGQIVPVLGCGGYLLGLPALEP